MVNAEIKCIGCSNSVTIKRVCAKFNDLFTKPNANILLIQILGTKRM